MVGIALFAWLELVYTDGDVPRTVALASFAYSAVTFVGMSLYGVEAWINRAEAFSVYFNLFARVSPWERRGREVGLRRPLAGLAKLDFQPGTVALLAVMIGTVTFDGASEGPLVQSLAPALARGIEGLGLDPGTAVEIAYTAGVLVSVLLVYGLYRLGVAGARTVGGQRSAARLAAALVHTLVPIALVYVAAHYLTLLVFQASDPLGTGADIFGTAGRAIDYTVLGANTVWYLQVAMVLGGRLAALILAHDRALVLYPDGRAAVRSQYWMLAVMIAFTSLALSGSSPRSTADPPEPVDASLEHHPRPRRCTGFGRVRRPAWSTGSGAAPHPRTAGLRPLRGSAPTRSGWCWWPRGRRWSGSGARAHAWGACRPGRGGDRPCGGCTGRSWPQCSPRPRSLPSSGG